MYVGFVVFIFLLLIYNQLISIGRDYHSNTDPVRIRQLKSLFIIYTVKHYVMTMYVKIFHNKKIGNSMKIIIVVFILDPQFAEHQDGVRNGRSCAKTDIQSKDFNSVCKPTEERSCNNFRRLQKDL